MLRYHITVELKLSLTLCFLASLDSCTIFQYTFRVFKSVIFRFVPKVCKAIIDTYMHEVLKLSKTSKEWKTGTEVFTKKWNYNNLGGELDKNNVPVKKSKKGGSLCYIYNKFQSIIIMVVRLSVDADVGAEGCADEVGTWIKCNL
ncbi:uncharacterized protein [Palaemon carinicauda]|uniref:uncharacterized protein n=1 Tax=Palaemon carinicauda TaxID=392227 RepID=UPI0035B63A3D